MFQEVHMMKKRIQIPASLYNLMVDYINDHYDPRDRERFHDIQIGIQNKIKSDERHNIYTAYKAEADPETKELLRTLYLDKAGIPSHGRWSEENG
jgi:hypothetical protein